MEPKTIYDICCPHCGSIDWYQYSTDEIDFCGDGTGHYRFDIHCAACNKDSRVSFKFTYEITESEDLISGN